MTLPVGHAGSWFATWNDESLPCIHKHALNGSNYIDNGVNDHAAWPRFIAELRNKQRAILTTSYDAGENGIRRRNKYIGVFPISDIEVNETTLTFTVGPLIERFA